MEKTCSECNKSKPVDDFVFIKSRNRHMHYCRDCKNAKLRAYRAASERHKAYQQEYQQGEKYKETVSKWRRSERGRKLHRERMRKRRVAIKEEVMRHYGDGKLECCRCGFSDIRALSVDHIDGSGSKHRKELGSSIKFYPWLQRNGYPDGFQVLCMNCQFIKRAENHESTPRIE